MQDEKKGESWTLFYRNAVCFRVSVSRADILSTPFEKKWSELNKEGNPRVEGMKKWGERWNDLCDCIITQCMPLLQELAPSSRRWKTLEDYLRTPTYELKLIADDATGDAVAKVTSGPVEKPSYEHHLMEFSEFNPLPKDLCQYRAEELVVLNQEKDWRRPPYKLRTAEGDVLYFKACNKRARNVTTGQVSNYSVHLMNAYSQLHLGAEDHSSVHTPRLRGIVVSGADGELEDWDMEGNELATDQKPVGGGSKQPLISGILLDYVSKSKTLGEVAKLLAEQLDELTKCKPTWKEQVTAAVQYLHNNCITIGGDKERESPWFYINQHTLRVAPTESTDDDSGKVDAARLEAADAWLMVDVNCAIHPAEEQRSEQDKQKFEEQKAMDWGAVEKVFQF